MTEFPRFDLAGQIALVTGAARGLGRAIALALAHAGADVALGLRDCEYRRRPRRARSRAGPARAAAADGRDPPRPDRRAPIEQALEHFGRIDILVNNAGIGPENLAENVTEDDFDLTLARQPQGDLLRQPGGRPRHDPPAATGASST